jgi:hypothetical protein
VITALQVIGALLAIIFGGLALVYAHAWFLCDYTEYTYNGHTVRLVWNSRFARICGMGSTNCCVTMGPRLILVSRNWIIRKTLSHEWGHVLQGIALGLLYLPWVLLRYAVDFSYRGSKPERLADDHMNATWREFSSIGPVPTWVYDPAPQRSGT